MAIRELVTAFTFQTDLSGLNAYNHALEKTKVATEKAFDTSKLTAGLEKLSGVAFKLTNMMGLTFAIGAMDQLASKAMDYVKEIINGARETNRLNAQIVNIVGNTQQAKEVQESLYALAQKTGMEYADVAEMSKGILIASKEQKIPFEESTKAISQFVLALKVGKASTQETAEAIGTLEQGLRLGKIGPRAIGRLIQGPAGQFLADQLTGGNLEQLRADAAKKGFSIKRLIEGLAKPSGALDAKVAKLPFTIGRAFTMIKNDMTEAAAAIMKLTAGFGGLGKMVWNIFSFAKGAVLGFVDTLGGLRNTVELVGYALALALGPLLIRNIVMATASLVSMAIASWAVWAPWLAIGVAIAVAALAIQDFMLWMEGGKNKTVLGDLLGPFDAFKKSIEDFPLVKIFAGITDFFKGDFGQGFETIKNGFASIQTPADALWVTIGLIGGAFTAWKILEFTGIIGALGRLTAAFKPVQVEAAATATAIQRVENATNAPGAPVTTSGAPGTRPGRTPIKKTMIGAGIALPFVLDATLLAQQAGIIPKTAEPTQDRLTTAASGSTLGATIGMAIGAIIAGPAGAGAGSAIGGGVGGAAGFLWPEVKQAGDLFSQTLNALSDTIKKTGITIQNTNPLAVQPGVPQSGAATTTLPTITLPSIPAIPAIPAPFLAPSTAPSAEQPGVPQTGAAPATITIPPITLPIIPAPLLAPPTAPSAEQAGVPQTGAMPSIDLGFISKFFDMLKGILPDAGTQAPSSPSPNNTTTFNPFSFSQNAIPQVMPFDSMAGAKTVENTVNAGGINQTNNITVTAQMNEDQVAQAVRAQVTAQAPDLLDRVSRQLSDAIPRSERATV